MTTGSFYLCSRGITLNVFHSSSLFSFQTDFSLSFSWILSPFALLSLLQLQSLFFIITAVLFLFRVSRIFFLTLSVSSPSYLRILIAQRLRVLFRLFYAQSMRQMLAKNPFINVEVKDLLSSCILQKFPVVTIIFWMSYIDYPCSGQANAFLFRGNWLTVVFKFVFNILDDLAFNSFMDYLSLSFPLSTKAKPSYFLVAQ